MSAASGAYAALAALALSGCSITSIPSDGYKVTPVEQGGRDCLQVERVTDEGQDVQRTALGIYCREGQR